MDGEVPPVPDARAMLPTERMPRLRQRRRNGRRWERRDGWPSLIATALVVPVLVAATVDMLRVVRVGPATALGLATVVQIALAALALATVGTYPRTLLVRLAPFGALLGWALLSTAWHLPAIDGAQNGLVYLLFGLLLLAAGVSAAARRERTERIIDVAVIALSVTGLTLALVNADLKGWPQAAPRDAAWWYVNPRPYALMGLVPIAWHLARWYHGRRWDMLPVALWVAAIFVSLSRTATATAMLLVAAVVGLHLRRGHVEGRRGTVLERLLLTAVPIAALVAAVYFQPFNERLVEQSTRVGGGSVASETRVKDSGRLNIWSAVLASTMKAPVFGQGLGTANAAISEVYEEVGHPHDDYLRIWHDLGLVGLVLFVWSLLGWCRALYRDWRASTRSVGDGGRLELAALLTMAGLVLGMITDNSLVYACVMAPAGVIVGAGLGGIVRPEGLSKRPKRRGQRRERTTPLALEGAQAIGDSEPPRTREGHHRRDADPGTSTSAMPPDPVSGEPLVRRRRRRKRI